MKLKLQKDCGSTTKLLMMHEDYDDAVFIFNVLANEGANTLLLFLSHNVETWDYRGRSPLNHKTTFDLMMRMIAKQCNHYLWPLFLIHLLNRTETRSTMLKILA